MELDETFFCLNLISDYPDKIILPIDIVTALEIDKKAKTKVRFVNEIKEDEIGLDIGPGSLKVFKQYISDSKTIFWNGPAGYFELDNFADGTKKICEMIADTKALTIAGGGETISAIKKFNCADKFTHLSTGGGASLAYLEGKPLPALKVIDEKNI